MSIFWFLLIFFLLAPTIIGLLNAFWTFVTGLIISIAGGMGYGVGKFLRIAPKDQLSANFWLGAVKVLTTVVSISLNVWVLATGFSWLFPLDWVLFTRDFAATVWFLTLIADFFCVFMVGCLFGDQSKVRERIKINQE